MAEVSEFDALYGIFLSCKEFGTAVTSAQLAGYCRVFLLS
jgi:hypothetical protein